jgi:uncharacterized Zn-finger protein
MLHCHICWKAFKDQFMINRHVQGVHEDVRRGECNTCGKKFHNQTGANDHERRVHFKEKRECTVCKRKIGFKNIQQHERTCRGIKQYPCIYCENMSTTLANVNAHMQTQHIRLNPILIIGPNIRDEK